MENNPLEIHKDVVATYGGNTMRKNMCIIGVLCLKEAALALMMSHALAAHCPQYATKTLLALMK